MRAQPICRVINALRTQHRLIVHLACGHNLSIPESTVLAHREDLWTNATSALCPDCPDAPPPAPSAHQLWREAGEP